MRVILFDLDDTLFDQLHCSRVGLAAVQARYAEQIGGPIEDFEETYHDLLEEWHMKVLAGLVSLEESRLERFRILLSSETAIATTAEAQAAADCYRDAYEAAYQAVPGAIELLRRLKTQHPVGIVTNHIVSEQVKKIGLIGVEPFVDDMVVSEEVGVPKPDPKVFETALSRLGGTPEEAVMVGDSWSSDIVGAAALGIRAIWLNRYNKPCPDSTLATEIRALEPVDEIAELILNSP